MNAFKSPFVAILVISIGLISCSKSSKTPYQESLEQDAKVRKEKFFASTNDAAEKLQFAVGHFFGYYLINVETKVNYCRQLGVEISPFITAFKNANDDIYVKAAALLAKEGLTENQMLFKLQDRLVDLTFKSMADQATAQGITTTVVCARLRDYGSRDPNLAYRKSNPEVYRMLMDAN
ncbi:MAG TPA: hypothetical protein VGO37_08335 [Steroidobacteraceae bacterium]|jgi:hypothetical protein|nr:hypothetical protein [Steroidobacteraceae bacterium]